LKEIEDNVTNGHRLPITFDLKGKDDTTIPPQVMIIKQLIQECWDQMPANRPSAVDIAKQINLLDQENDEQMQFLRTCLIH